VDELARQFEGVQRLMLMLERDLGQVVNRPVRNIYGDFEPAFSTREDGFALVLTRQGWRNPLGLRRSGLQRVAWEYTGEEIRRHYWVALDKGQEETDPRDQLLLSGVKDFSIRFYTASRDWTDQWPREEVMASMMPGQLPSAPLPRGVEVTIEHERYGELTRLFTLPDFDSSAAGSLAAMGEGENGVDGGDTAAGGER
jgi:general secretion pathway protein J